MLSIVAGAFGFIHIVFGVVILSSEQLVSVWEVLNHIIWRYIISAIISRLVLNMELNGLIDITKEKEAIF